MLEAHLDGELDATQQMQVGEHLEGCSSCSDIYSKLERLQTKVRSSSLSYHAPDSLRQNVIAAIRKPADSKWKWTALAASVLLAISVSANVLVTKRYRTADETMAREVLSEHVRSMLSSHMIDVVSSDRHTVKPWFAGKLDFSPDVKDLSGEGFPLAGGRVDYLDGRPVAGLVFQRAKHVITLFTWPSASRSGEEVSRNGYHLMAWSKEGMTYWAVSDVNASELKQFASLYQK